MWSTAVRRITPASERQRPTMSGVSPSGPMISRNARPRSVISYSKGARDAPYQFGGAQALLDGTNPLAVQPDRWLLVAADPTGVQISHHVPWPTRNPIEHLQREWLGQPGVRHRRIRIRRPGDPLGGFTRHPAEDRDGVDGVRVGEASPGTPASLNRAAALPGEACHSICPASSTAATVPPALGTVPAEIRNAARVADSTASCWHRAAAHRSTTRTSIRSRKSSERQKSLTLAAAAGPFPSQ